jgi:hypothetical protein
MRKSVTLCLAASTAFLVGCNQPAVSLKAPAFQSSENTIRDWNDVAHRITSGMVSRGLLPAPASHETVVTTRTTETLSTQLPGGFLSVAHDMSGLGSTRSVR